MPKKESRWGNTERKRRALAQHGIGRLGIAAVSLMENEAGAKTGRRGNALARANDDTPGIFPGARP